MNLLQLKRPKRTNRVLNSIITIAFLSTQLLLPTLATTKAFASTNTQNPTETQLPANGVESLSYVDGHWTIVLKSAQASEVKLITPGPQEISCSQNGGVAKNGHPLCDKTTYTYESQAECVTVQVDWEGNVHNSSDPVACRDTSDNSAVKKVQFCHATSSATNPYVYLDTSVSAFYNSGHNDHSGDIVPPFSYVKHGQAISFPGSNWDTAHRAIYNNHCEVLATVNIPEAPATNDQCGPHNATWTKPADTAKITWTITNGHLIASTTAGNIFSDNTTSHDYGVAVDSNESCPPKVVAIPSTPEQQDQCGPHNATWTKPADTAKITWTITNGHLIASTTAGNIFSDNTTSHDYGVAVDSNESCLPGDKVCVANSRDYTNNDSGNITTQSGASFEFVDGGLKLTTPNSSSKVFGYYSKSVPLKNIDQIAYDTYRAVESTGSNLQVPSFQIGVDVNGAAAGGFTTLVFEPIYTYGNNSIVSGTWQHWDAFKNGDAKWWSSNPIPSAPNRDTFTPWKDIVAANPDAQVLYYGFSQGSGNEGIIAKVNHINLDCDTINYTKPRPTAEIKVTKKLFPATDKSLFNLNIDSQVKATNVGDGGTTGFQTVYADEEHGISETAGSNTSLNQYNSTYYCIDSDYDRTSELFSIRNVLALNNHHVYEGNGTSLAGIQLHEGQKLDCTFVNKRVPTITIVKDAQPNSSQSFTFDTSAQRSSFNLIDNGTNDGQQTKTFSVNDGQRYNFSESDTTGWSLTDVTCDSGSWKFKNGKLKVTAEYGQNVTCTFVNKKLATVSITKDAQPNSSQAFTFTSNLSGSNSQFRLTDDGTNAADASIKFTSVLPGEYMVSEGAMIGWTLSSITCSEGTTKSMDGSTLKLTVKAGENLNCTYVNKNTTSGKGGDVLGATTTKTTPTSVVSSSSAQAAELANTGESTWVNMVVGLMAIIVALGLTVATRKQLKA